MDMFKEFTQQVINAYQAKKGTHQLATALENPSAAKLRDQCLQLLANKNRKKDHAILKEFFDPMNQYDDLETRIRRDSPDILKPLVNFMKNETNKTEEKNVKLLAALIDFEPRPYSEWYTWYQDNQSPIAGTGSETDGSKPETLFETFAKSIDMPPEKEQINTGTAPFRKIHKIIASIFATVTAIVISLIIANSGDCMFWNGDQYKCISCRESAGDATIIALNKAKMKHFRKITRLDTITYNSIGKMWYSKIDNNVEFFTERGSHPIHTERKLKPVTKHIIDTYTKRVGISEVKAE